MFTKVVPYKTIAKTIIGLSAIATGGLLYVIFRPESLLMFSWFDNIGVTPWIGSLRMDYGDYTIYSWIKYNLPAGLWLFSYLFLMDALWDGHQGTIFYYYFMSLIPVMAIASELLQYISFLPGTFDVMDLVSYLLAIMLFYTINKFSR